VAERHDLAFFVGYLDIVRSGFFGLGDADGLAAQPAGLRARHVGHVDVERHGNRPAGLGCRLERLVYQGKYAPPWARR
jgi:hypothetical protein